MVVPARKQVRDLRALVRYLLPEFETSAGGLPPQEMRARRTECEHIRTYLRKTKLTPLKTKNGTR